MARFIARRILLLIPILIFSSIVIFGLVRLTPGDPAAIMVGGRQTSPEVLHNIRVKYGLDQDPLTQYFAWWRNVLRGDLGESFVSKQNVTSMIAQRIPITLKLGLLAGLLSLTVAIPLGILSAVHRNTWVDYVIAFAVLIGTASPVYFTAILSILVFSFWLGWLPAIGMGDGTWGQIKHLILPASVLTFSSLGWTTRMTRAAMLNVLHSDYIRTARAKGLSNRTVIWRHALRNASIPLITVAGLHLGFLLSGSVLVEYTFGLGGLGSLVTDAVQKRDYPVVQGTTLLLVVFFVFLNLLTDVVYVIVDPRIRHN